MADPEQTRLSDLPAVLPIDLIRPPAGRPSVHTQILADEICTLLAEGNSLLALCRRAEFPAYGTVMRWVAEDRDGFREKYARAREIQGHNLAEQAVEIARIADDPQKGRLAYDALKWQASKMAPKVFGEKITHAGDPENPLIPPDTRPEPLAFLAEWMAAQAKKPDP